VYIARVRQQQQEIKIKHKIKEHPPDMKPPPPPSANAQPARLSLSRALSLSIGQETRETPKDERETSSDSQPSDPLDRRRKVRLQFRPRHVAGGLALDLVGPPHVAHEADKLLEDGGEGLVLGVGDAALGALVLDDGADGRVVAEEDGGEEVVLDLFFLCFCFLFSVGESVFLVSKSAAEERKTTEKTKPKYKLFLSPSQPLSPAG
jgi:hypothetical protein